MLSGFDRDFPGSLRPNPVEESPLIRRASKYSFAGTCVSMLLHSIRSYCAFAPHIDFYES